MPGIELEGLMTVLDTETSLEVQQLRLCASNAGARVQSLVGDKGSRMPWGMVKKTK